MEVATVNSCGSAADAAQVTEAVARSAQRVRRIFMAIVVAGRRLDASDPVTMGGFIHILLVVAVVMILINLISGRRVL